MSTGTAALQPTFTGHVNTTHDALVLFEACLTGHLSHVPRRPHDRERNQLIRSGSVFIYEENASGIKRWTDGVTWSPSRILGNFLVYRELDKPFPPGEKKRAMKKNRRPTRPGEPYPRPEGDGQYSPTLTNSNFDGSRAPSEMERSLIGSLIDSYGFKENGLVKKTMSVTVQGVTHHLVSYYNVQDVLNGTLRAPSQIESLSFIRPRMELLTKQSFRSPIEETDETIDGARDPSQQYGYRGQMMGAPGYGMPPPGPFYGHNPPYPPQSFYPNTTAPPYGVGLPPAHNYLGQQVSQTHKSEYDSFPAHSSYSRSYEAMANSNPASSLPPSMGSLPTNLPDRSQSQHPSMYSQTSVPSRQVSNPSPAGLDSRSQPTYNRGSYGNGQSQPADNRRSMQPSPAQSTDRRDTHQIPQPIYSGTGDRPPYYMNGAPPPLSHGHYPSNTQIPPWSGNTANQPPI